MKDKVDTDGLKEQLPLLIHQYGPASPIQAWMQEAIKQIAKLEEQIRKDRHERH